MTALALVGLGLLFGTVPARHDVETTSIARVFLDETGVGRYELTVVDTGAPPLTALPGLLPSVCRGRPDGRGPDPARHLEFTCERPLTFSDTIELPWSLSGVVVLARWQDGTEASGFYRGSGRSVRVPLEGLRADRGSLGSVAHRYFVMGVEHILFGLDHLFFVLGLLVLVRGTRPLLVTITAFTVAHSLTLGAAAAGFIPLDPAPVEAAIALSIMLLAREIVVLGRTGDSAHLIHRRPWIVAFVFGLLHGLGFAGALGSIGLRSGDIPLALLFFNVGVEAGQIAFVVVAVAALRALAVAAAPLAERAPRYIGYALGSVACLWLFERLPAVFLPS
ncbi:MAG: HupE/UreJ family protein [Gemmatimonadota bacterium]